MRKDVLQAGSLGTLEEVLLSTLNGGVYWSIKRNGKCEQVLNPRAK